MGASVPEAEGAGVVGRVACRGLGEIQLAPVADHAIGQGPQVHVAGAAVAPARRRRSAIVGERAGTWFNQSTHSKVANSTCSTVATGRGD
jgi:hypothetical protein